MFKQLVICIFLMTVSHAYFDRAINVGTVLFSPTDAKKVRWSTTEIALLNIRRYFQDLLPPPNFIDTSNEAYIETLLKYFRDTYATIKREANNQETDSIMTTAFSDAIGGYLNLWVLPITKLAFYGGTVSQNNVIKLFRFHKELKRFLGPDAKGWRSPDKDLLRTITINIAPPQHITRNVKNPCKQLAYYEKTESGLNIPTPYINWEDKSYTMFVPLKNHLLIPLDSYKYPNALSYYYDTAKNCLDLQTSDPTQSDQFDNKFQAWLANDVVPHLSDENVYLALGNILTLVNNSHSKRIFHFPFKLKKKVEIAGIPINLSSKKNLIIIVILFLEIAWCIPALLYLACTKKKKKVTISNVINKKVRKKKPCYKYNGSQGFIQGMSYKIRSQGGIETPGFKIQQKPQNEILESEACKESKVSMATSTTISVVHETRQTPLKSSLKKIRSSHTNKTHSQQTAISLKESRSKLSCCYGGQTCTCSKCSLVSLNNIDSLYTLSNPLVVQTRPFTFEESVRSITETISHTTPVRSLSDSRIKKMKSKESTDVVLGNTTNECPCVACFDNETDSQVTVITQEAQKIISKCSLNVNPSYSVVKESVVKNVGLRLEKGHPYLEIMIQKPQTEISVGIGGIFDPLKNRRSKIPKRLPNTINVQMSCRAAKKETRADGRKSLIPQLKRRPLDDLVIKCSKTKNQTKDNKLNVTL